MAHLLARINGTNVFGVGAACVFVAASSLASNADAPAPLAPMAFMFITDCQPGFEVDGTSDGRASIMGQFTTSEKDYFLTIELFDKIPDIMPANLEVLHKNEKWYIQWKLFKPNDYLTSTLTSLAIARHRIKFNFYFHGLPGTSVEDPTADGMILDGYSIKDSGAC